MEGYSDRLAETTVESIELKTHRESSSFDEVEAAEARVNVYSPIEGDPDEEWDDEEGGSGALLGSHRPGRESPLFVSNSNKWTEVKSLVMETLPTLALTTVGLLFTGEILNNVSHWKAMSRVDELIMIIPVVLNLKGNLEMNLSARLGTAANIGQLDDPPTRKSIILGNLTLLQVQAAVVSFVAAVVAFLLGRIIPRPPGEESPVDVIPGNVTSLLSARILDAKKPRPIFPAANPTSGLSEFIMVASAAMMSTALASGILGGFMSGLVLVCRRFGLDPDNIAPPVAACLGDLVTLVILGVVSALHLLVMDTILPLIVVILLSGAAVCWAIVTRRNKHVSHLLLEGWSPLFVAMIISSGTGLVLDEFVSQYTGFALLSVVVTGLAGNAGSVFVSRLSTSLHSAVLIDREQKSDALSRRTVTFTLLLVSLPVEIAFLGVVYAFGWLRLSILFVVLQVVFFCVTVVISLYLAQFTTDFLWKRHLDPDMYALPFHSALVDLVGQLLLVCSYEIATLLGAHVRSRTER